MNRMDASSDLARAYALRFGEAADYRVAVWKILISDFFQPIIGRDQSILDLGCGWGEFINQIEASQRFGMDLNPDSSARLHPGIRFLEQNCAIPWALPDASLDVVFTSNFLEHLPSKAEVDATLAQARRCLNPGGRIICLGPNIKYLAGRYWDFWDHFVPITEASLCEVLRLRGFAIERCVARFLPYTMSDGRRAPLWLIRAYIRMPWIWPLFGRQFLVIGRASA